MTPLDLARAASSQINIDARPIFGFWRDLARLGRPSGVEDPTGCERIAGEWRAKGLRWDDEFDGAAPLQLACLVGRPEMIRALISLGADPSDFNQNGVSALACAIELRQPLCAQALMESGARLDLIRKTEHAGFALSAPLALSLAGMTDLAQRARALMSVQLEQELLETAAPAVQTPPTRRTLKGL